MSHQIAFCALRGGLTTEGRYHAPWNNGWDLYLLPVEDPQVRQVTVNLNVDGFGWSPDGQKLAFVLDTDGEYSLGVLMLAEERLQAIPMEGQDVTGKLHPDTPSWSPDGKQIAFTTPGKEHLYVVEADGTTARCIATQAWRELEIAEGATVEGSPSSSSLAASGGVMSERSEVAAVHEDGDAASATFCARQATEVQSFDQGHWLSSIPTLLESARWFL